MTFLRARAGGRYRFARNSYSRPMESPDLRQRIAQLFQDAEQLTGLLITVHDRDGSLTGQPLDYRRFTHQHPVCTAGRGTVPGYDARCQAHCRHGLNAQAGAVGAEVFVHRCWKGVAEVCVPIHRAGAHRLTLFAGAARAGEQPPPELTLEARRAWRLLPDIAEDRLLLAGRVLAAVGQGLLTLLDEHVSQGGGTRKAAIDRFIEAELHRPLAPADLGGLLGVSPSRAAHIVVEVYGTALGDLLRRRRLARAKHLLTTTDETVGVIAARCGFISQHWFNRLFARVEGSPPGTWRRRQRPWA